MPVIDIKRDYGAFVRAAIESKELGAGSEVLAAAEYISFDNVMAKWSKRMKLPRSLLVAL